MQSFQFPHDVLGWLTEAEGRALAERAAGKYVIEVGAYQGRSTVCLAQTAQLVVSIDPHRGYEIGGRLPTLAALEKNLRNRNLLDRVAIVCAWSWMMEGLFDRGWADLVFIDGDHEWTHVQADILRFDRCLKLTGAWAFHDYGHPNHPGVKQVVDSYARALNRPVELIDTLAVIEL